MFAKSLSFNLVFVGSVTQLGLSANEPVSTVNMSAPVCQAGLAAIESIEATLFENCVEI
jgi:hypothetical protein